MDGVAPETQTSLSLPWKTRLYISAVSAITDAASRRNGTVNRRLLSFVDFRVPPTPKPINGVKTYDVVVDPARKLWFRVFVPTEESAIEELRVMIYFHGGGFVFFNPDLKLYDDVCRRFAKKLNAIVVSVDYRHAPEHKYPAQHDDCFDVLKFLDSDENRSKWLPENANISRCFLAGDSAGGNLAHHAALRACEFNFQQLKIFGLVLIQPFFGGEERTNSEKELDGTPFLSMKRTDWLWKAFMPVGEGYDRDHQIINVSGPKAVDVSKMDFPPTILFTAGFDILRDWNKRYYAWLKKSGKEVYMVDYPNMCHIFHAFPELPESDQLMSEIKDFIQSVSVKV
nr:probable carboxylesterase 18 [Tanacetum cinerariifolium]